MIGRRRFLLGLCGTAVLVSGCTPAPMRGSASHKIYTSLTDLAADATDIAQVICRRIVASRYDGASTAADGGIPTKIIEFEATSVSQGSALHSGERFFSPITDWKKLDLGEPVAVAEGNQLVLFLERVETKGTPLDDLSVVYPIVGVSAGMFDVRNDTAQARDPGVEFTAPSGRRLVRANGLADIPIADLLVLRPGKS